MGTNRLGRIWTGRDGEDKRQEKGTIQVGVERTETEDYKVVRKFHG